MQVTATCSPMGYAFSSETRNPHMGTGPVLEHSTLCIAAFSRKQDTKGTQLLRKAGTLKSSPWQRLCILAKALCLTQEVSSFPVSPQELEPFLKSWLSEAKMDSQVCSEDFELPPLAILLLAGLLCISLCTLRQWRANVMQSISKCVAFMMDPFHRTP